MSTDEDPADAEERWRERRRVCDGCPMRYTSYCDGCLKPTENEEKEEDEDEDEEHRQIH